MSSPSPEIFLTPLDEVMIPLENIDEDLGTYLSNYFDIEGSFCDLNAIFKDITVLGTGGASSTVQLKAKFEEDRKVVVSSIDHYIENSGSNEAFVKISFKEVDDNSTEIEKMVYIHLSELIYQNRTPNIMRYIASFKCDGFLEYLTERNDKVSTAISRNIVNIRIWNMDVDFRTALFTIVELGSGKPFSDVLSDALSENAFKEIVFQLFYTLRQIYLDGIRHNDIHTTNIWINILPRPVKLIYFINDKQYAVIETKYIVKIYDFDLSAFFTERISNTKLTIQGMCSNYGICENDNERFDLLIATHTIGNAKNKHVYIKKFLDTVLRNKQFIKQTSWYKFPGRYCEDIGDEECSPTAEIDEDDVYNINQLCQNTNYFDEYLKDVETFDKNDIPIKEPASNDSIPLDIFTSFLYVSKDCRRTSIEMANYLLKTFGQL